MARRELGPASLAVVQAVDAAVDVADRALLVACSGGPDSLALAFGAWRVGRRRRLPVAAMVIDHGLQSDSARVAEAACAELVRIGYGDLTVERVSVDLGSGGGTEAAARDARYRALSAAGANLGATILLGHTLDDQAESVLLGLARGSGARSLTGMPVRAGGYLRPLLALRRQTTEASCAELDLHPWADPHNSDRRFRRVRVRELVLPTLEAELGPGIAEALARTATLLADDAELLDRLADEAYPGAADPAGRPLDCQHLRALPPALRRRVLLRWLRSNGASDVSSTHLLRLESLVTQWHGQGPVQLPALQVVRRAGELHIVP
ncbi:MAG TPA: tRNA lysidine(34) synthetase TilS [Propionibacteriaceae bacterium]|nr:tRNA lysidine(34) synthetase TilS [Propionibacteriaceae bacterium]